MTTPQELKDWLDTLSPAATDVVISGGGLSLIALDKNGRYTGECFDIGDSEVRDFDDPATPHDEDDRRIWQAIRDLDADLYDVDAAMADWKNGNFPDESRDLESYHFCRRIIDSITNGQHTQARSQIEKFGDRRAVYDYACGYGDFALLDQITRMLLP